MGSVLGCTLGCTKKISVPSDPSHEGNILIGEVGSMTGADATFGISTHQGILLALTEINAAGGIHGRKLELITLDDQGKASEAVLATQKLMGQQKVRAVF